MLDDLAAEIHDAALEPQRWTSALTQISDTFRGAGVLLIQGDVTQFHTAEAWGGNYDATVFGDFPSQLWALEVNPGMAAMCAAPLCAVTDRRAFLTDDQLPHDPSFRHFVADQGLFHAAIVAAQRDQAVVSLAVIARARNAPEFDGDETRVIAAIGRHVGQAMRVHRALRWLEHRAAGLPVILDRLASGAILIDGTSRILYANSAAERMLDTGDGLRRRHDRLRLACHAAQRRLAGAVRRLSGPDTDFSETRLNLNRPSGALPYMLTVLPALGDGTSALAPRAGALVLIDDPEAGLAALSPQHLAEAYELTPAEARVAALAGQALSVAGIARRAGVSSNTVKTHLKAIYGKLGIHSQAELVRILMARATPVLR